MKPCLPRMLPGRCLRLSTFASRGARAIRENTRQMLSGGTSVSVSYPTRLQPLLAVDSVPGTLDEQLDRAPHMLTN
jgi:hypothetical protein